MIVLTIIIDVNEDNVIGDLAFNALAKKANIAEEPLKNFMESIPEVFMQLKDIHNKEISEQQSITE